MDEAIATHTVGPRWRDEALAALVVWVLFTGVVVLAAPIVAGVPLRISAPIGVLVCVPLGWAIGRAYIRWRPGPRAGLRVGIALVIVGQLLDVVLVVVADGYPRAGETGSVTVLTLLLGGYPAALIGAALADRRPPGP